MMIVPAPEHSPATFADAYRLVVASEGRSSARAGELRALALSSLPRIVERFGDDSEELRAVREVANDVEIEALVIFPDDAGYWKTAAEMDAAIALELLGKSGVGPPRKIQEYRLAPIVDRVPNEAGWRFQRLTRSQALALECAACGFSRTIVWRDLSESWAIPEDMQGLVASIRENVEHHDCGRTTEADQFDGAVAQALRRS